MNARMPRDAGWFEDIDPADVDAGVEALEEGTADYPREWPALAVESGAVPDEDTYYERLREVCITAASRGVTDRELADDQQLIHAIRSLDDCERTANELTERVAEWAGSHDADVEVALEDVREIAASEAETPVEQRLQSLAAQVVGLHEEAGALRSFIESTAPEVAPNTAALAGPILAARLISLAGGLESLAKQPAGTVQVLGAEDALFAHLRGGAPSPKHGVIYTHEMIRNTPADRRGAAARALSGKLVIAARIDHYSGDRRPDLEADLEERIERLRGGEES